MFENKVIEIIQFLLEESNRQKHLDFSDNKLKEKLSNKGFTEKDIHTALKLFDYKNTNSGDDFNVKQIRTFHEIEKVIIPAKLQGILLRLKESGLISSFELEALIEEIMIIGQINGYEQAGWIIFNKFFMQKYGFSLYDDMET